MSRSRLHTELKKCTGYILPCCEVDPINQDVLESEDEAEEIQPEFMDMNEMDSVSSGGKMLTFSVPASKKVYLQCEDEKHLVKGRFPLCDPWWEVTCTVNCGRSFFTLHGTYISYRLRTDLSSEGHTLVSLFLKECGAEPEHVKMFMEWLPNDRNMEPANVLKDLQDFEESSCENVAKQLRSRVKNSGCTIYNKLILS